jgi:Protein of unknown function (DUF4231)
MVADQAVTLAEPPVPETVRTHPAWFRLIDQKNWYDRNSRYSQRWYKRIKLAQVTFAVLVPAASLLPSAAHLDMWAASTFGVMIAVLEAIQQMNQYSTLWFSYRATAERLKHEQFLFLAAGGPYRAMPESDRLVVLAERVEECVSTEHANWFTDFERSTHPQKSTEHPG